jgi:hypothetical protein
MRSMIEHWVSLVGAFIFKVMSLSLGRFAQLNIQYSNQENPSNEIYFFCSRQHEG